MMRFSLLAGVMLWALSTAASAQEFDLLSKIDIARDRVKGEWTWDQKRLVTSGAGQTLLQVPGDYPPNYSLLVVAERLTGKDSLNIGLLVAGRPIIVVLEGFGGRTSGLNTIDGSSADRNETKSTTPIFPTGKPAKIVCIVRGNDVQVICDGRGVFRWAGDPARLGVDRRFFSPDAKGVVLGSWDSRFRIEKVTLTPIGPGGPPFAGPPGFPPPPGYPLPPGFPPPPGVVLPPAGRPSGSATATVPERSEPKMAGRSGAPAPTAPPPVSPAPSESVASVPTKRPTPAPTSSSPTPSDPAEPSPKSSKPAPSAQIAELARESTALVQSPVGTGSAFVVGPHLVATAAHVVQGAFGQEIELHFQGKRTNTVRVTRVVYEDVTRDICLLEAPVERQILKVARDHEFQPLDGVVLLGNPSVDGVVILRGATVQGRLAAQVRIKSADFYQIDARVNPGSSGGPVLDGAGDVIGLIAMKVEESFVGRLRNEFKMLDSNLAAESSKHDSAGITFAVPGPSLGEALKTVELDREGERDQVHDLHDARTAVDRLAALHELYLMRSLANAPPGLRKQYDSLARQGKLGRVPTGAARNRQFLQIPSEANSERFRRSLESGELHGLQKVLSKGMRGQVERLAASSRLDERVKTDLDAFFRQLQQVVAFSESPSDSYQKFNSKYLAFDENAADLVKRLQASLTNED